MNIRTYNETYTPRKVMKSICKMSLVVLILSMALSIGLFCVAQNDYDRQIGSFWSLSVKASSLQAKAQYLDKFVAAVQGSSHTEYNAHFLKNPDNNWQQNMDALLSLQQRMHEIQKMDVTSTQYQWAMQQITQQEQDEASKMLSVFEGCWFLANHTFFWDWHGLLLILGYLVLLVAWIVFACIAYEVSL